MESWQEVKSCDLLQQIFEMNMKPCRRECWLTLILTSSSRNRDHCRLIDVTSTYPQYSMYLYMTIAIPIAIAAKSTDVMSIIERHNANPRKERVLGRRRQKLSLLSGNTIISHKELSKPTSSLTSFVLLLELSSFMISKGKIHSRTCDACLTSIKI